MDGMRLELFGHLGGDVELQYTPSGKMVTSPSVGVTLGRGDNKSTQWVKATFWEKSAELFGNLAKKGTFVWLSGVPKIETWEKDGETQVKLSLTVRDFKILKGGKSREEREDGDNPYDSDEE